MPATTLRTCAAHLAILLLLPALFLEGVSLTRPLAPGNPLFAALEALSSLPQWHVVNAIFTAAVLLGPLLALALCLLAVLRLEWRREPGGVVTIVHVRDQILPLVTIGLSLSVLALLFLYAFFENFVPR